MTKRDASALFALCGVLLSLFLTYTIGDWVFARPYSLLETIIWIFILTFIIFPGFILIWVLFTALAAKIFPQLFKEIQDEAQKEREKALARFKTVIESVLASLEKEPEFSRLRDSLDKRNGFVSSSQISELLSRSDLVLAGFGSWLKDLGIPNNFPRNFLAGVVKGKIETSLTSLSSQEKDICLRFLPKISLCIGEGLKDGLSSREIVETFVALLTAPGSEP